MALADGYIGSFDTKYHYRYWRPVTAIRAADADGNPPRSADPDVDAAATTPPIPDYDSAHAVEGGAAAAGVPASSSGPTASRSAPAASPLPAGSTCNDAAPVTRSYASFTQAAEENGLSRILVGFHFRKAVHEGIQHGRQIGRLAADRLPAPDAQIARGGD